MWLHCRSDRVANREWICKGRNKCNPDSDNRLFTIMSCGYGNRIHKIGYAEFKRWQEEKGGNRAERQENTQEKVIFDCLSKGRKAKIYINKDPNKHKAFSVV